MFNPLTAINAIDTYRFYSSMGKPSAVKGLIKHFIAGLPYGKPV